MTKPDVGHPPAKTPGKQLRIVFVEDQHEVRESWTRLIGSLADFTCIATCSSGEEALRVIPPLKPDAVLMDIFLPRMSGIECTSRLKAILPQTRIVMLTAVDDDEMIFLALEAGADGYLLKRTKPMDLRAALLDVLGGGAPMTSEIARRVVESFRHRPKTRDEALRLTSREEEVLVLLSKGYSNKEIADRIGLSVDTVRSHLKHIYEKMHVRSRTEAVIRYMGSKPAAAEGGVQTHYPPFE
jgi:DNA-binding NarL/FixJ family response regulator